ncbi:MAG: SUMF1/EgtB/PvdO family nonheme iron enzyme [Deltaproteobacteria bacterium]|nr:SUMF1/EgtB/PvdO family nonheme iron enzyme [Deltaproteobacteria bacterium]
MTHTAHARLGAALLCGAVLCGCDRDPTALVVVFETDLHQPMELDALHVQVERGSKVQWEQRYVLGKDVRLPASLTLLPGDDFSPVSITATGTREDDPVVIRQARVGFLEGRVLMLPIGLHRACYEALPCPSGETCIDGHCRNADVEAATLPDYDANDPLPSSDLALHDGPQDAGIDGSASPHDSTTEQRSDLEQDVSQGCTMPSWQKSCPNGYCEVPAGCFLMGSPKSDPCFAYDEVQREVRLTRGFSISESEVTRAQFAQRMDYSPSSQTKSCTAQSCPVETVNWHEAAAYCNALSSNENLEPCYVCQGAQELTRCAIASAFTGTGKVFFDCKGYRLPSEAEWEYAYRAGTQSALYNGEMDGNCNTSPLATLIAWYDGSPKPVMQKMPNDLGLHDMAGNVAEWVQDYASTPAATPEVDPLVLTTALQRILRGGWYAGYANTLRAAARDRRSETDRLASAGFRCARTR